VEEIIMRQIFRFFSGVIFGALIGSLAAILFAPFSGKEFRARITDNAIRMRYEIQQAALSKRAELEKELSDLRQNIVMK
jgi:gas vesicle protein